MIAIFIAPPIFFCKTCANLFRGEGLHQAEAAVDVAISCLINESSRGATAKRGRVPGAAAAHTELRGALGLGAGPARAEGTKHIGAQIAASARHIAHAVWALIQRKCADWFGL